MTPMICWLALPDFRQVWFLALAPLLYQPEFPMWLKNSNFSKSQNAEKSAGLWFYNVLYMWFHIPWCFHPLMFGMVNKCIFLMCGLTDRCLTRGFAASVGNGRPRSGQDYSAARACGWLEAQHSHQAATWGLLGSNLDSWFFEGTVDIRGQRLIFPYFSTFFQGTVDISWCWCTTHHALGEVAMVTLLSRFRGSSCLAGQETVGVRSWGGHEDGREMMINYESLDTQE